MSPSCINFTEGSKVVFFGFPLKIAKNDFSTFRKIDAAQPISR
jgi:hypothetical protein